MSQRRTRAYIASHCLLQRRHNVKTGPRTEESYARLRRSLVWQHPMHDLAPRSMTGGERGSVRVELLDSMS